MRFGRHPDQDHLNDYWNALERYAPPDEVRRLGEKLDPARKAALDQARSEYQRARPDPAFLARLETELMNVFATTPAGAIPLPVTVPYPNGRRAPERSTWLPELGVRTTRRRWALASFAAALLILLAGIGGYFLYESQTDNPAVVPATQEATPDTGWTHFKGNAARSGVGMPAQPGRRSSSGAFRQEVPAARPPIVVGPTVYAGCGDGILYALECGRRRPKPGGSPPMARSEPD